MRKLIRVIILICLWSIIMFTLLNILLTTEIINVLIVFAASLVMIFLGLGLLSILFFRFSMFSRWFLILPFIFLPSIGLITGYYLFQFSDYLPRNYDWRSIDPPPDTPSRFLSHQEVLIFNGMLFVQTENGKLYALKRFPSATAGWADMTDLNDDPGVDISYLICPSEREQKPKLTPLPPGKVIDSYTLHFCDSHGAVQYNFILLEDRRLFGWFTSYGLWPYLIIMPFFIVAGFVPGIVLPFVIFGMRFSRDRSGGK